MVDFPSAGMPAAKADRFGRGPGGASRPWRDIMRRFFFHRFASDHDFIGQIRAGIRFSARGWGTGCLAERKQPLPNPSCSRRFCPAMYGTPPLGREYFATLFIPSIGRRPYFKISHPPAVDQGPNAGFARYFPSSARGGSRVSRDKASLWPGRKGGARKKHRREKKSIGRSGRVSAK